MTPRTRTFLSMDIVGSTDALRRLGLRYAMVLETVRRVLEGAASDRGGVLVDAVGDSMLFAFGRADDAVLTALIGQAAIATAPDEIDVDVRMGVHTGPVWEKGREFIGLTVHKTARVTDVASGGQILVSSETLAALGPRLHDHLVFVRRTIPNLKDFGDDVLYELRVLPATTAACTEDEMGTVASAG